MEITIYCFMTYFSPIPATNAQNNIHFGRRKKYKVPEPNTPAAEVFKEAKQLVLANSWKLIAEHTTASALPSQCGREAALKRIDNKLNQLTVRYLKRLNLGSLFLQDQTHHLGRLFSQVNPVDYINQDNVRRIVYVDASDVKLMFRSMNDKMTVSEGVKTPNILTVSGSVTMPRLKEPVAKAIEHAALIDPRKHNDKPSSMQTRWHAPISNIIDRFWNYYRPEPSMRLNSHQMAMAYEFDKRSEHQRIATLTVPQVRLTGFAAFQNILALRKANTSGSSKRFPTHLKNTAIEYLSNLMPIRDLTEAKLLGQYREKFIALLTLYTTPATVSKIVEAAEKKAKELHSKIVADEQGAMVHRTGQKQKIADEVEAIRKEHFTLNQISDTASRFWLTHLEGVFDRLKTRHRNSRASGKPPKLTPVMQAQFLAGIQQYVEAELLAGREIVLQDCLDRAFDKTIPDEQLSVIEKIARQTSVSAKLKDSIDTGFSHRRVTEMVIYPRSDRLAVIAPCYNALLLRQSNFRDLKGEPALDLARAKSILGYPVPRKACELKS